MLSEQQIQANHLTQSTLLNITTLGKGRSWKEQRAKRPNQMCELQLTIEQGGLEPHVSTYTGIFFFFF